MQRERPLWMLKKRVHETCNYDTSWEEKAFAKDTCGLLDGSCVWPPRSYTCTFCNRDFRSAQALGGHMNVHRRDRARLRQYLNTANDQTSVDPPHPLPHPNQNCEYFCSDNPYPNICHPRVESQVSNIYSPPPPPPCFVFSPKRYPCFTTHDREEDTESKNKEYFGPSLSISLVIKQNYPTVSHEEDIDNNHRKRKRVEISRQHEIQRTSRASMVDFDGFKSSVLDELDLELRLGSSHPKVR